MNIFGGLLDMVNSLGSALIEGFDLVSQIFYTPGVNGGLTLVGYLLVAALAVGFIKMALNLVVRLFTRVK